MSNSITAPITVVKNVISAPITTPKNEITAPITTAGRDAYQLAVASGFVGTRAAWLESLIGPQGLSAYELAVAGGFVGDLAAWLVSLIGPKGDEGEIGPNGVDEVSPTPPLDPLEGDRWFNSVTGLSYTFYDGVWVSNSAGAAYVPHASRHAAGGDDPITPASIGAAATNHNHAGVYQPVDANLVSVETPADGDMIQRVGGSWVTRTIAQIKTALGLGSAAYTASTDYAAAASAVSVSREEPGNYTVATADAWTYIELTGANPVITLTNTPPNDHEQYFRRGASAGAITLSGSGQTILGNIASSVLINGSFGVKKKAANTWWFI